MQQVRSVDKFLSRISLASIAYRCLRNCRRMSMSQSWIDFTALKEAADFLPVLGHYNIELKRKGSQRVALCPFHEETKPSCSINLDKKVFQCFGCRKKGNILDFVKCMEQSTLPDAAKVLAEVCSVDLPLREREGNGADAQSGTSRPAQRETKSRRAKSAKIGAGASNKSETAIPSSSMKKPAQRNPEKATAPSHEHDGPINPPLTFSLTLDTAHPYLDERMEDMNLGDESMFGEHLFELFGLGVANRGSMKNRLCIPIHNEHGELIAYAGRWALDDETIPEAEGKYKLPKQFAKNGVLFNLNRVLDLSQKSEQEPNWVVVTEGYFGAIRLHALGVPVVSVMGTSISDEQLKLLDAELNPDRVVLLFDGDEQGKKAAHEDVLPRLATRFFVHNATNELADDEQPDEMTDGRLLSLRGIQEFL